MLLVFNKSELRNSFIISIFFLILLLKVLYIIFLIVVGKDYKINFYYFWYKKKIVRIIFWLDRIS